MTLKIAQATPADLPDLLNMIAKLCAFHGDISHMGLDRAQTDLIGSSRLYCLIAKHDDQHIGYAILERHWRAMNPTDALDIAHLYVCEGWRGRGVGRALITAAKQTAQRQKACRLTIGTAPNNPGAAACYRAMGLSEQTGPNGARFSIPLEEHAPCPSPF